MLPPLFAYIGPGAGFAFLGGFLSLIVSFLLTVVSFLTWPIRTARALILRRHGFRKARFQRVIFLGLDGLDPRLTERFMAEGLLPNLQRLQRPRIVSPPSHDLPFALPGRMVDFRYRRAPGQAQHLRFPEPQPEIVCAGAFVFARAPFALAVLKLGRFRIPLSRPVLELRRKSQPFWKLLGERAISSTIIRVPITFPPEKFDGRLLSAMCTPDLRGTQGQLHPIHHAPRSTPVSKAVFAVPCAARVNSLEGTLEGPDNDFVHDSPGPCRCPFGSPAPAVRIRSRSPAAAIALQPGEYSPWIKIAFSAAPGIHIHGIARFLITETEPEFSLYVTPIQIDPESPALPISHPSYYAVYLAKLLGSFATVGMAEDTWALERGRHRRAGVSRPGLLAAGRTRGHVRQRAGPHPPRRGCLRLRYQRPRSAHVLSPLRRSRRSRWQGAIADLYQRMDRLVGKAMDQADAEYRCCSFFPITAFAASGAPSI